MSIRDAVRLIGSIIAFLGLCLVYWTGHKAGASESLAGDAHTAGTADVAFRAPSGPGYFSGAEVEELLRSWADVDPDRIRLVSVAQIAGRMPVTGIEFSSRLLPLDERPPLTVLLLGGADGTSLVGGEAVLRSAHALLDHLDELRPDVRVVAIPRCAPDPLARTAGEMVGPGLESWSPDEDQDGLVGEDAPDDLDGDGMTLDMLIEAPDGEWCLASDRRVLIPAGPRDAPRYRLTREGRDDDADGLHNEDSGAGIDWGRTFPVGWSGPSADGAGGERPMQDPVTRAVADFVLELDPTVTMIFAGNHGGLRFFQGSADGDSSERVDDLRTRLAAGFARATGRPMALDPATAPAAWASEPSGTLGDWLQAVTRGTVVEVSPWGPSAVWMDGRPLAGSVAAGGHTPRTLDQSGDLLEMGREPDEVSVLWMRWLDDVRGGAGFVDWHPVDLGSGVTGLVGGWEPMTKANPPVDQLPFALEGMGLFVEGVVAGLPRYEIDLLDVVREGALVRIRARVANRGVLDPVAGVVGAADEPLAGCGAVALSLEATCDAAIIVGGASTDLGQIRPGAVSAPVTWVIEAPVGGVIALRALCPSGLGALREVRP